MTQLRFDSTAVRVGRLARGLLALTGLTVLVAGLPWALWHFVGWPLPDHLPDAAELRIALNSGLTGKLLVDLLAIACWIAWAVFVIDLLRCLPGVLAYAGARARQLPAGSGPMYGLAALLLSTGLVPLLGIRTSSASAVGTSVPSIAATSTHLGASSETSTRPPAEPANPPNKAPNDARTTSGPPPTVVVREPHNGIHDSLWRIAERELGDGARWPQLYRLNQQRPQPDGRRLTNPNLIYPGWVLELPAPAKPTLREHPERTESPGDRTQQKRQPPDTPADEQTRTPTPHPTPEEQSPPASQPSAQASPEPSTQTPETAQHSQTADRPSQREADPGGGPAGIDTETGAFVGLGVAAAISAALVAVRLRRRRWYRPGSGRRDDLTTPPIVRALRREHLRAITTASGTEGKPGDSTPFDGDSAHSRNGPDSPDTTRIPLGVREGHELVLDLASARGIGLIGPGAQDAARALLLTLLATPPDARSRPEVLVTQPLLDVVLDEPTTREHRPPGLYVVPDLDAALDHIEAENVRRTRLADEHAPDTDTGIEGNQGSVSQSRLVLIAAPPTGSTRRLQAALDNGSTVGIVGVLAGQWRSGGTVYIDADGTVAHTNPGWAETLRHVRLFTLPAQDANELLALLHEASDDHAPDEVSTEPDTDTEPEKNKGGTPADLADVAKADGDVSLDAGADCELDSPLSTVEVAGPEPVAESCPTDVDTMSDAGKEADSPQETADAVHLPRQVRAANDQSPPDAATPTALLLDILGPPRLRWRAPGGLEDIGHTLSPRQREVLLFLALHPRGVHRDVLLGTLWPDSPRRRPTNALHTALSKLRHALGAATTTQLEERFIVRRENHYRLDPACIAVDFWGFTQATTEGRAATDDAARAAAYQRAVDAYGGELGQGLSTEWIEGPREAARRDAVDAASRLARIVEDSDAQRALDLLELVRAFDPHNETVYRDIMRIQAQLGHPDAVARTLSLLTTRLGELGLRPDEATVRLATSLQQAPSETKA